MHYVNNWKSKNVWPRLSTVLTLLPHPKLLSACLVVWVIPKLESLLKCTNYTQKMTLKKYLRFQSQVCSKLVSFHVQPWFSPFVCEKTVIQCSLDQLVSASSFRPLFNLSLPISISSCRLSLYPFSHVATPFSSSPHQSVSCPPCAFKSGYFHLRAAWGPAWRTLSHGSWVLWPTSQQPGEYKWR